MRAVFLDRDGVINENREDHVKGWSEFEFIPGALEAVARLSRSGAQVFVVTNQAGVSRGLMGPDAIDAIHERMIEEIERAGGRILDTAYCPHSPEENCSCRKPLPGLIFDLAKRHGVDLRGAAIVGDALTDVEAGLAAGCQAILVMTGRGSEQAIGGDNRGSFAVVADLQAAVDLLIGPS